ncbi:MAG: DNA polymerase III subunit gamma/tau [Ruminococcaceae bacterium]|nr:DNA polymerase III subunit gamma/tau [Oscillospiraceae bacterium]
MEHQALYRKWRPKTFDDVVGQQHVTQTIKNEIKNNVCGHAFLFCGSRGTGKTSTARILSKAVNCESPVDGNPCNKCATCQGIENGSIMDIIEIDAASNSGVDNIRSLREEASYTAAVTKHKVYIIDEVHALSKDAFNALLKLLEEPPAHVKFVLATTEANKVLETISSRCQRFDFKRITPDDIYNRLDYICNAEGIMAEEKALRMIALHADGSLRDALSCLDPCIAAGKEVDTAFVSDFLGRAENDAVLELCRHIGGCDAAGVVSCIDDVCSRGKNLSPFIETLIRAMRDMLIISVSGKCKSDFDEDEYALLEESASAYSTEKLLYAIKSLSEAVSTARFMTNPRVVFEAALIKLCTKSSDGSYEALSSRIAELERKIESGVTVSPVKKPSPSAKPAPQAEKESSPEPKPQLPPSEFLSKIQSAWPEVMNDLSASLVLFTALENVQLREENGKLALTFPDDGGRAMQDMVADGIDSINAAVKAHTGLDANAVTRLESDFDSFKSIKEEHDPLEDIINLPITNIE